VLAAWATSCERKLTTSEPPCTVADVMQAAGLPLAGQLETQPVDGGPAAVVWALLPPPPPPRASTVPPATRATAATEATAMSTGRRRRRRSGSAPGGRDDDGGTGGPAASWGEVPSGTGPVGAVDAAAGTP